MAKLYSKQLAALDELKESDPKLTIEWDEDTGTPSVIRGVLSPPSPPIGTQSVEDAAQQAALSFLHRNKDLYRLRDPGAEFGRSRVVSDAVGKTVRLYQMHEGVEVFDGELSVAVDDQNRVRQVLGRYRPMLRLSTEPVISSEQAVEIALHNLDTDDKEQLAPITHRLIILNTGSFPDLEPKLGQKNRLAWRIEIFVWVYFIDARDGSVLFTYENAQDARNRQTYSTTNCRELPGTLWIAEDGPVAGQPVDDIAWSAHNHVGTVYDYYYERFGLDSFDGMGQKMVSTVHGGVPGIFGCTQNNAAFIPSLLQIVYGDGDGEQFGPFSHALDVVAHEWQHAITYFAITWSDGRPRGLDYRDQSGALNESYSDVFGALVENKNWLLGEDCYTPKVPGDALRDMEDPTKFGQPDHFSKYTDSGTQGWKVHHNSGIMNKCGYLMVEGGTHYGITVKGMGREATAEVWFRALKHHLHGASTFREARPAMLQACEELFPGDTAKYRTVQNAFAAVGLGDPAPPPSITVEPAQLDFETVTLGESAERTVTVRNDGSDARTVSSVQSSHPAYAVIGDTAFSLAPGTSKTLTVRFAPTGAGPQDATLTIESNDVEQPITTVALYGAGLGVVSIAVEPSAIDFGGVTLGQSAEQALTIRNNGTLELTVSKIESSEPVFSTDGDGSFALAPGATQALAVRFAPVAVGSQDAALRIESNDADEPVVTVDLAGRGVGLPTIGVEPAELAFGSVLIGQSADQSLTVRNTGSAELVVSDVQSSDPAFAAVGETAFQLAPGVSQVLTVRFSPAGSAEHQGILTIASNDSEQPALTVALSGTGYGVAEIGIEPASLEFGQLTVGRTAERGLTVRNQGSAELVVSKVESDAAAFAVAGETAFQLNPGAFKALTVRFAPAEVGLQEATLTIESNAAQQPSANVALSGEGLGVPIIGVEPAQIDFGTVTLGQSAERTLTVRNDGSAALAVSAIKSSHPAFSVLGETAFELAPNASQELNVQFLPTGSGERQAALTIESSDANLPTVTVGLSGIGFGMPGIVVQPEAIDFAPVALGQSSEQAITVRNEGSADLQVSAVRVDDPSFAVLGDTMFQLAPGASQELTLRFSPSQAGVFETTLSVQSNDTNQPTVSVALSGTALGVAVIAVEPDALDFGTLSLGDSTERALTVGNEGTAALAVAAVQCSDPAFTVVEEASFELPPGQSRALSIRFAPSAAGELQATLSIESNDTDQPTVTVGLSGKALGVPGISVIPSEIDFGTLVLGQSSERILTVRNTGSAELNVSSLKVNDPAFTVSGETAFTLTSGASKRVTIRFLPTTVGQRQVNLIIESNDTNQPTLSVVLSGRAVGVSSIVVEPTSIDFGAVRLGQSADEAVTVRNTGSANLGVSQVQSSELAFVIIGETAFELAPNTSKALVIQFSPTLSGQVQGSLIIESNDSSRPQVTVPLSGAGVSAPAIAVQPARLDFGTATVGESIELTLTISNGGGSPLLVSDVQSSDPAFATEGDTEFEVEPGTAKVVVVRFTPLVEGPVEGTLSILSDAQSPTVEVALAGTGRPELVEGPHLLLEPQQLSFGSVPVGQTPRILLTVKNHGTEVLTVHDVKIPLAVFGIMGDASFEVQPSNERQMAVRYRPTSEGVHSTRLSVLSNDPRQPEVSVPVFGTGTRCVVSTAAYGTPVQKDVRTLRVFRDESLLNSSFGRKLVSWYYRWNDSVADLIAHSETGRSIVRALLRPLIAVARSLSKPNRE